MCFHARFLTAARAEGELVISSHSLLFGASTMPDGIRISGAYGLRGHRLRQSNQRGRSVRRVACLLGVISG